jgi:hypothetical protein
MDHSFFTESRPPSSHAQFSHQVWQQVAGPFTGHPLPQNPTLLQQIVPTGLRASTSFLYNRSGEMSRMTAPMGGFIQRSYGTLS